jgi:hypothetical protein
MRIVVFSLVFLVVTLAAGCAPDNVTACRQDFVEKVNDVYAQCGQDARFDADEICPDRLNDGEDCTGYFQCLGDAYQCDEASGTVTWETDDCDCA